MISITDKYSANTYRPFCENYITRFEALLNIKSEDYELIQKAKELATLKFYIGESKSFKNISEIENYFRNQILDLLRQIKNEFPKVYEMIIKELDRHLISKKFFNDEFGIITPQRKTHLTLEQYYRNYELYKKILDKILAILGVYKK